MKVQTIHPSDPQSIQKIPLMESAVKAGFPSPADDYLQNKIDLNQELVHHPAATFFSRQPLRLNTGSVTTCLLRSILNNSSALQDASRDRIFQ